MINNLPLELACTIFDAVPAKDRARLMVVCKAFKTIAVQDWGAFHLQKVAKLPEALDWIAGLTYKRQQPILSLKVSNNFLRSEFPGKHLLHSALRDQQ